MTARPAFDRPKLISIVRERFPPGRRYSNASHPFWEVVYTLGGSGLYRLRNGVEHLLREGVLVVTPPQTVHTVKAGEGGMVVYTLLVDRTRWPGTAAGSGGRAVETDERILLDVALSRLLEKALSRTAEGTDGLFKAVLALLDMELGRPRLPGKAGLRRRDSHAETACRETIRVIHESFREPLTVGKLAAGAGLSLSRLAHVFRQAAGVSVVKYIIECRLNAARHLLATDTDMPIKAVADEAGFRSANHFYVQFKKRFGMSPLDYRQSVWRRSLPD